MTPRKELEFHSSATDSRGCPCQHLLGLMANQNPLKIGKRKTKKKDILLQIYDVDWNIYVWTQQQ